MNRKEIAEIKKTLAPEHTSIDFVVTAMVSHRESGLHIGKIKRQRLLSLEEDAILRHLEVAKNTLSGRLEKNLLNTGFPTKECLPGGCQEPLVRLLKSGLSDDALTGDFIRMFASNCDIVENMMVQLVHAAYDVPIKTKNKANNGESDTVYEFILCSACPLAPEKPGIAYDDKEDGFAPLKQRMVAGKPAVGFLYPAFNDRASDLNQMLFFAKKEDDIHPELILALTGGKPPIPAGAQKKIFTDLLKQLDRQASFDDAKSIHGEIRSRVDNLHLNEEDTHATKSDIRAIIESAVGAVPDSDFDKAYDGVMGGYDTGMLSLENIVDVNKFDITVPDIQIKVKPDKIKEVEQKMIDGRKCFVIPVSDSVAVNGMPVEE